MKEKELTQDSAEKSPLSAMSIERGRKEGDIPKKFYRNINEAELFMLWRDQEVPMGRALPDNADSDAPREPLLIHWFDKPLQIRNQRMAFLELDASNIEKDKISSGDMRFQLPIRGYDRHDVSYSPRKQKEFYIQQRIKKSDLKIYVTNVLKEVVAELRKKTKKEVEDTVWWGDNDWDRIDPDTRQQIAFNFKYEFGEDPINYPPCLRVVSSGDDGETTDKQKWVYLDNIDNGKKVLFMQVERFRAVLDQQDKFYEWIESLPTADWTSLLRKPDLLFKPLIGEPQDQ